MEKIEFTVKNIQEAAERISPYIHRTPLLRIENMDELLGCELTLKPEMFQITGAFKIRGALNKVLSLPPEVRKKGIVATSSGNHAIACAYVGHSLGIKAVVVIPASAPAIKIQRTRELGAEVFEWERDYFARWDKVCDEAKKHGYTIVVTDDDLAVLAGQGTVGYEIVQDMPDVETVLVPIGGGGIASGVSTAIKGLNPNIRVIGVQPSASCVYYVSRQNRKVSRVEPLPTLADALTSGGVSKMAYPIIEKNVDEIVIVEEDEIREAVRALANHGKVVAEPSSCVTIAALMYNKVKTRPDEKVCAILTGGNWDVEKTGRLLNGEDVEGVL